jgi:Tol biopolymer transport system component
VFRRSLALFAIALVTIGACEWTAGTAAPLPQSKIAFQSNRAGRYQIYLMNADGSGVIPLTNSSGENRAPAFSPDGRRIAFISTRDESDQIYVMNADGSNASRLTTTQGRRNAVAFSRMGAKSSSRPSTCGTTSRPTS